MLKARENTEQFNVNKYLSIKDQDNFINKIKKKEDMYHHKLSGLLDHS